MFSEASVFSEGEGSASGGSLSLGGSRESPREQTSSGSYCSSWHATNWNAFLECVL